MDGIQWPIEGFGGASFVNDGRGTSSVNYMNPLPVVVLEAVKDVEAGDELCVYYQNDYFADSARWTSTFGSFEGDDPKLDVPRETPWRSERNALSVAVLKGLKAAVAIPV